MLALGGGATRTRVASVPTHGSLRELYVHFVDTCVSYANVYLAVRGTCQLRLAVYCYAIHVGSADTCVHFVDIQQARGSLDFPS